MHKNLFLLGISAMLIFAVSFSYAVEENDIVVYYSFDKLNEKTFTDDSGNGNDAELTGSGKLVDGQFGKAIHLNGGVVQMSPANDFVVPIGEKGEATLEAWFLMNSHASHSGIISIETIDAGCCEFRMMVSPNFKPFWDAGHHKDKSLDDFTFELKKWYHYVLVADGKDGKIYVNGDFIGSQPQPENFTFPKFKEASIYIGAGEGPTTHPAEDVIIDEVVIYSKTLTEDEVKASYEFGSCWRLGCGSEKQIDSYLGSTEINFLTVLRNYTKLT